MSPTPSAPRQTLSYLRDLFEAHGIRPKKKLGQSFLIDLNLLDVLLQSAELGREDLVLEVGSGTGSLTARLAEAAGAVLSVELDPSFVELARAAVAGRENVEVVRADILKNKNEINPVVLDALARLRGRAGGSLKLVANLPYAVASPLIANFLLTDLPFARMVVTVQWEIAERLSSRPGTKAYGALAILVQSLADVTLLRRLPPEVFWPRPKVASAFVSIVPRPEKRRHVGEARRFRSFLRDLYSHRRKNLRGALIGLPSGRRDKEEVDRKLAELGLEGTCRAEELDIEQHLRLCAAFA